MVKDPTVHLTCLGPSMAEHRDEVGLLQEGFEILDSQMCISIELVTAACRSCPFQRDAQSLLLLK